jgi:peptidoglycan hydrolase-like protein with peptidoglycan-binding domain
MLALATSIMMAAPLLAVPGFAQAPATSAPAPATPAPAAPAPVTPAPATPAPAAGSSSMPGMSMPAKPAGMPAGHAAMRMERIKKMQTALNAHGASVTVDGKMGPKTKSALMAFQKANNLKMTGMMDKETAAALMK